MKKRIVFSGGGTMGSVSPLLAVAQECRDRGYELYFVGTHNGPERESVESYDIPFEAFPSAKLPRYISAQWLAVPFQLSAAVWRSFWYIRRIRPDVIVVAGGYVAVPLSFVAAFCFGIPTVIHQQDVVPTLSNKLMARWSRMVTVTFEVSLKDFAATPKRFVKWIGNPVRSLKPTTSSLAKQMDPSAPTVLIMGGGTGAAGINALVSQRLCDFANIIHITGKGKSTTPISHARYHAFPFLKDELAEALSLATICVSRAGMGSMTELATIQVPTVFIPMPSSHQEQNAAIIEQHNAGIVLEQSALTPESFAVELKALLAHTDQQTVMAARLHALFPEGANTAFVAAIESVFKS